MAVNITWSTTNGGSAIVGSVDHGSIVAGNNSAATEIFVRHDGANPITDCGFYIAELTGTYTGAASKSLDLAELLGWGDASIANDFGGFQINMDATGGYSGSWPSVAAKAGSTYSVFYTGVGDSAANKISLVTQMGCSVASQIQAGSSPNVRFQARLAVPLNESVAGVRQFDQRLQYTYTS